MMGTEEEGGRRHRSLQRRRRRWPRAARAPVPFAAAVASGLLVLAAMRMQQCAAWRPPVTRCQAQASPSPTGSPSGHRRSSHPTITRGGFAARTLSLAMGGALLGTSALLPKGAEARTEPLGVVNELLADCGRLDNCVSSQDDRPPVFAEPWAYEASAERAMRRLRDHVSALPGAEVITADQSYLRCEDVGWAFALCTRCLFAAIHTQILTCIF